jgi:hypothetical protein
MSELGHNPNASEAERMRVRETFNLHDHLHGINPQSNPTPSGGAVNLDNEGLRTLARAVGLELVTAEEAKQIEELKSKVAELELKNQNLLSRLNKAEAKNRAPRATADTSEAADAETV